MKSKIFNIQKFSLHDGNGIRTSVFFSKCNLRCKWCSNPECYVEENSFSKTNEFDLEHLLKEILKDKAFYNKSGGGVTLTGGEIFMQFEFVEKFCKLLKENDINIAIETAGFVDNNTFKKIAILVDYIYIDCKHYDNIRHIEGTGVSNELIIKNIEWLAQSDKEYCIRIPVIPNYNNSICDAQEFCKLFKKLGVKNIELLPFHQFGENKYKSLKHNYAYAGVKQLHNEDSNEYYQVFKENKFNILMK